MQCPKCEYRSDSLNSLRIHSAKQHKLSSEDLYLSLFTGGSKPTCKCGCGEHTSFDSLQKGYNVFIQGHASRVNNNWGHNEEARERSLKKRRDEGLWSKDPWNRGKKKDADPEFAKVCERSYSTDAFRKKRSKIMKEQWESNNLVPQRGPNHSQWKGGTSALGAMCHGDSRLYRQWKLPKLQASGFKCSQCGSGDRLHVHHDGVRMAVIIGTYRRQLPECELTHEQKLWVVDRVVEHHERESVSGVVLCEQCHEAEHESLNFSSAQDSQ
jgi:hypothetical protein